MDVIKRSSLKTGYLGEMKNPDFWVEIVPQLQNLNHYLQVYLGVKKIKTSSSQISLMVPKMDMCSKLIMKERVITKTRIAPFKDPNVKMS